MAAINMAELEAVFTASRVNGPVKIIAESLRDFLRDLTTEVNTLVEGASGGAAGDEGAIQMSDGAGGFADSGILAGEDGLEVSNGIYVGDRNGLNFAVSAEGLEANDDEVKADFSYVAKSHTFMVGEAGDVAGPIFREDGATVLNNELIIWNPATSANLQVIPGASVTQILANLAGEGGLNSLELSASDFDFKVDNGSVQGPVFDENGKLILTDPVAFNTLRFFGADEVGIIESKNAADDEFVPLSFMASSHNFMCGADGTGGVVRFDNGGNVQWGEVNGYHGVLLNDSGNNYVGMEFKDGGDPQLHVPFKSWALSHTFMVGEAGDVQGPVFNESGDILVTGSVIAYNTNMIASFTGDDPETDAGILISATIAGGNIEARDGLGGAGVVSVVGALALSAANTVSAEVAGASTHKAAITIGGTDYLMLLIAA